jgi:hypothetical protein
MKKRIVLFMALGLMSAATIAKAGTWYEAATCVAFMGLGCHILECSRSDSSPAQMVEANGGITSAGNSIKDGPADGEVEATVNAGTENEVSTTFSRTKKGCQAFIAPAVKAQQEEEKEQEKENRELEKKYD